jgi:uncharacterized protein YjaZ
VTPQKRSLSQAILMIFGERLIWRAKNWMPRIYNGNNSKTRPADLGYYIGYKICESYYRQAKDKKQAVREILETKAFTAFLQESGYAAKFGGNK